MSTHRTAGIVPGDQSVIHDEHLEHGGLALLPAIPTALVLDGSE